MTTVERALNDEVLLSAVLQPVDTARASHSPAVLRRLLVAVDVAGAAIGWGAALAVTGSVRVDAAATPMIGTLSVVVLLVAITIVAVSTQKLYLARICTIRAVEILRLGRAAALATTAALIAPRVLPIEVDVVGAVAGGALALVALVFGRGTYRSWLQSSRRDGKYIRPIVIVGDNEDAGDVARLITDHPEMGYRVLGYVGDSYQLRDDDGVSRLGSLAEAASIIAARRPSGVVVAASAIPGRERNALIRNLLNTGVHVQLTTGLQGIDHRRLLAQPMAHEPMFYVEPMRLAPWQLSLKRVIDVLLVLTVSVVALPVLAVAAIAIKLTDRGSVIFKQQRIGRFGEPFTMYKLRTMIPNAESLVDELAPLAARDGPSLKLVNDPRRTRVGRFLERTSIDELPQILNVLRGEMSLVGPRPALVADAAEFDDELEARHAVRPGITGLWQIEARDNPRFSAYRRYDLFYLENWSVSLDLAIMLATVQRVIWRSVELMANRRGEMAPAIETY